MTETGVEYIAMAPGFTKPELGSVVAIVAVDWGYEGEQLSARYDFKIVYGTIYGRVIVVNDEQITVAMQIFHGGDVRSVLSIPWRCVEQVTILEHGE